MSDFVHLHTHSEYSMLDGLGRVKDLVAEAKRLGQHALALTDHGVMHGAVEFSRACRAQEVKPIIGVEAYQTVWGRPMNGRDSQFDRENYHLLLLAKNMTGYRNLLKIASNAQTGGYYYKPRVDHDFLAAHAEGIVCTTGCLGAEVPQLLMHGKEKEAYERFGWYVDTFGKENFFIELQEHSIPELIPVNKALVPWAKKFGIGLLATNDVHYVHEEDADPHEMLLCVQTGESIKSEKRMKLSDGSYFLKSRAQMEATFAPLIDLPSSAYDNSVLIAEMCDVDVEDKEYHLPDIDIPEGYNYETYLRHLTEKGLAELYGERASDPAVQTRKEHELKIIHQMGFDVYFLIVADLCDFARSRNIWWNVRGSGAGSVVAYTIGITGLDPLKNNLIFERFLNPDRVSMPDFDLDYPDDQREELIRYTIDKYGSGQVAQIVTFGRMKARAAIRDVGRAQEVNLDDVDRIAKLIPAIPGKPVTIQEVMTEGHEFYSQELVDLYKKQGWVSNLLDYSMKLEGVARHSGIHAAAVIIADRELTHYTPLMRASKGSITGAITQYEFPVLESIGLLKVDFLGLSTLSVMREAARLIRERHGVEYTLRNIPFEGEGTENAFKLLSAGEVSGVFQVDGAGMRRVLTEMQPNIFEHIIATISLYRPGPIEYIPNYIRRLHGEEEIDFKHEKLEPILGETYGICIYQEQIIQILTNLAGYSPGQADIVRRAISKKKASEIEKHKKIFIDGCAKNDVPKKAAAAIYADIEFFARYGFNKCLPGDVEVVDAATGRLVRVEDLYTGEAQLGETLTCDTDALKLQAGAVSAVMDNGVKPVYRLTTALGRTIEATANHPFYTFNGWRLLEELEIGGQVAVPRRLPVEGQQHWPDHEVIALGHLLAEGNLCHPHSVYFYSQDAAQVQDYVDAAEAFANVECSIAIHKGTYSVYAKRVERTVEPGIVTWAKVLGIWGKNALQKTIPDAVFELNNGQIGLLISRMWAGDGHINTTDRSLYYATSSERMARQLQHLLLRLGIISRLRTVNFPYKEGRIGYQLFVTGNDNLATFQRWIGTHFISDKRHEQMMELVLTAPVSSGTKDVIPVGIKELVRSAKEQAGVTWLDMNRDCGVAQREFYPIGTSTKSGFTRDAIARLADYFASDDLSRYADSDIYWDKITSIEYVGEKQTYDLEVPGTHNFVANDILVHNSHAADYAVITVQTAYLKAKYPVEYMAALLLIERDKTEKVTNFIGECRRMGIDVLAPDINYSGMDFEIQTLPEETPSQARRDPNIGFDFPIPDGSAIRFGMAAIKNVGENPVRAILEGREEGGGFNSLEDLCDRVDLRKVGKRPLECLIKAGALDRFGQRSQLLDVIEQLVAQSAGIHSARASGQISMFDMLGGSAAVKASPIRLPNIDEAPGRERLQWEKELLGIYVASHPLQQLNIDLTGKVTCQCAELNESHDGSSAVLVGMISDVRQINTKKGDRMAFVQLEDLSGTCDVVIFPRTFEEYGARLEIDSLVLIKGTAQTRQGKTSLLADSIQTHIESAVQKLAVSDEYLQYQQPLDVGSWADSPAAKEVSVGYVSPSGQTFVTGEGEEEDDVDSPAGDDEENEFGEQSPFRHDMPEWMVAQEIERTNRVEKERAVKEVVVKEVVVKEAAASFIADEERAVEEVAEVEAAGKVKPEMQTVPVDDRPQLPADEEPVVEETVIEEPADESVDDKLVVESKVEQGEGKPSVRRSSAQETPVEAEHRAPPALAKGHASQNGYRNGQHQNNHHRNGYSNGNGPMNGQANSSTTRALQITFRRSGNLERDKYRLKEIYDCVCDPKGRDRFVIIIESGSQRTQLSFPNDGCTISERLVGELTRSFKLEVEVEGGHE